jgi:hypothetical protein
MMSAATFDATGPPIRAARAVVAMTGALALGGAALAVVGMLTGGERPDVVREAPRAAAWDASTSIGPMSVQRVERFAGPPHGAGHAGADGRSDRIKVSVTLTNDRHRRRPFSPGQFRLRLNDAGTTVTATRPNPPPGSIAAGQTLRQRLTFVVPAPRSAFTLVFDDIGRAAPVRVELGSLPGRREG